MQKITPFLWFNGQAEEAMNYNCSILNNSKILAISHYGESGPAPKGTVKVVKLEFEGQEFLTLNRAPEYTFHPAISLEVNCITQQDADKLWDGLSKGGEKQICRWLKDKYGISWQVVPNLIIFCL